MGIQHIAPVVRNAPELRAMAVALRPLTIGPFPIQPDFPVLLGAHDLILELKQRRKFGCPDTFGTFGTAMVTLSPLAPELPTRWRISIEAMVGSEEIRMEVISALDSPDILTDIPLRDVVLRLIRPQRAPAPR